ncbi:hypothetical protein MRX96_037641 [Rhipicephalus microplus]
MMGGPDAHTDAVASFLGHLIALWRRRSHLLLHLEETKGAYGARGAREACSAEKPLTLPNRRVLDGAVLSSCERVATPNPVTHVVGVGRDVGSPRGMRRSGRDSQARASS